MNARRAMQAWMPPAARAKWLLFFSFLILLACLDSAHDYFAKRGAGISISVSQEIYWGFVFWVPYFFFASAVILVDRYCRYLKRARAFVIHALAGLAFTYIHIMIAAIPSLPLGPPLPYWDRFLFKVRDDFSIDYLFYFVIVVSTYMLKHYEDLKEGEIRASQLEASLAQTHLRAIQAQLNPHFFFNTLQGISVLALAGERDSVVEMLGRLSSLLRISFDKQRPQQISLAEEIEFLDSYLAIHQLSFGDRLSVRHEVAADTLHACVPSMLLQPLVENAIVHGLAVKPGNAIIRIGARKLGSRLILEVADSGTGFPTTKPYRSGVGLSATESRLKLLYGDEQTVSYGRSDFGGAMVTIGIPFAAPTSQAIALVSRGAAS